MKIKIFNACYGKEYAELEDYVNDFIKNKKVIDVKMDANYLRAGDINQSDGDITILVMYEEVENDKVN